MVDVKRKKKIVILGGGLASLSSAYELTNHDGWEDLYEISLYQLGWRLGGKVATGRGENNRIEEARGLHIFQGWYEKGFDLLKSIYKERKELGLAQDSLFQDWESTLLKNDATQLTEYSKTQNKWINWPLVLPNNHLTPGQSNELHSLEMFVEKLAYLITQLLCGSEFPKKRRFLRNLCDGLVKKILYGYTKIIIKNHKIDAGVLEKDYHLLLQAFMKDSQKFFGTEKSKQMTRIYHLSSLLRKLFAVIDQFVSFFRIPNNYFRRIQTMYEWAFVNLKGITKDVYDPESNKFFFSRINHLDYREWMQNHGASDLVLDSSPVRFLYTGTFSNLGGKEGRGELSAGNALRFLSKSLSYKGAFVWQFKTGCAENLVIPLYEVLKARGVKFKFFHRAHKIYNSSSGCIEKVQLKRQVDLLSGDYDPLIEVKKVKAWPSEPLYEQIEQTQAKLLQENKVCLESPWTNWQDVESLELTRGKDFDEIILGIPVGALKNICTEIIEQAPKWREMVKNIKTQQTLSMQLWLKPTLKQLGFKHERWGMSSKTPPNLVVYQNPFYSYLDSSHILEYEEWEKERPKSVAFFTGTLEDSQNIPTYDDSDFPSRERARVQTIAEHWLSHNMGLLWPDASTKENPSGFDFDHLVGNSESTDSQDKFADQLFSININPSDRYTRSVPNTDQYRLKTDESGFRNLFLAGDWINYGMNIGYMEGAIVSGFQAASALRENFGFQRNESFFADIEQLAIN